MTRTTAVALLLALALPIGAAADPVDDYIKSQLGPRHLPGLSLAVVKDGYIVKAAGYGTANLESGLPAARDTIYEIGSISKQFTAEAMMLLVEDGKLHLDDLLSRYLDKTPPAWAKITLRHVLTHTAGLPDFDTGDLGFSYRREYTAGEFVELLGSRPLAFEPGERWTYTNSFALLRPVIEKASGMPYEDFVTSRIFRRAGMTSARFKTAGEAAASRTSGYLYREGGFRPGEPMRPAFIAPNGGIMASVLDFAAWDMALAEGRLLRPESWTEMRTPVRLTSGRTVSHGLAWFMDVFAGHRFMAHWGSTVAGFSSVIRRYVDDKVTVIVMANLDDGAFGVDAISRRVADLYVPGTAIESLKARPQIDPERTHWVQVALRALGAGVDEAGVVPGLAARLGPVMRERVAAVARSATLYAYLGEEAITSEHFNVDPTLARIQRYRITTSAGLRYATLRLTSDGALAGVLVEE